MATNKQEFLTKVNRAHAARIKAEEYVHAGGDLKSEEAVTTVLRSMGGAPSRGAPFTGDVAITVGNAGLGVCSRPHPAARATNTNASTDIFTDLSLRISFSCLTSDKASRFGFQSCRTLEFVRVPSCISTPSPIERPLPTRIEQEQGVADAGLSASSC
jgi:hypothetical protein